MQRHEVIAAIRFGCGLAPGMAPIGGPEVLLADLRGPDVQGQAFPTVGSAAIWPLSQQVAKISVAYNRGDKALKPELNAGRAELRRQYDQNFLNPMLRGVVARVGFRERLQGFWANHFTVVAKNGRLGALPSAFADEAIRPHLAGPFRYMLRAVVTHPAMLLYLNQNASFGPRSRAGERMKRGLNENLGRELLELHTMGVGAPYNQHDVRQMAYLLTGLSVDRTGAFKFFPNRAEPGAEEVLGHSYGGAPRAKLEEIYQALDDIAARPETAHHLCQKLAMHFVADRPDPALVAAMARAYGDTGGDLSAVYRAMLAHPAAWAPVGGKVRQPHDFMVAALRALAVDPARLQGMNWRLRRRLLWVALTQMGQRFQRPPGPDGWHEDAAVWIQPQLLAARIQWAMDVPVRVQPELPDPRQFVAQVLADAARPATRAAAYRAESRREGIGLVLASNDFNRR